MQGQYKSEQRQGDEYWEELKEALRNLQTDEFIDPDFPHVYENIYDSLAERGQMEQVIWMPCEELHHKPSYSKVFTLKELGQISFVSSKMNQALILLKYFAKSSFDKLAKDQELSFELEHRVYKHFYSFEIMQEKEIKRISIDSFVPVSEIRNKEVFSETLNGCILPCLIEKLLAKVCNGYQNIAQLHVCQIVQMFSHYPAQKIKLKQIRGESATEQKEHISKVESLIKSETQNQRNLIFFKTKNNSKLQSFGLKPNHTYFIIQLITNNGPTQEKLISFLELPETQSNSPQWIGKFSKHRAQTKTEKLSQVQDKQLKQYENFMSIKDMSQVAKQIIILHNTLGCSIESKMSRIQNWKNLTKGFIPDQDYLIENNIKSQIIHINQSSQKSIELRPYSSVGSSPKDSINEQNSQKRQILETETNKEKNVCWLLYHCEQIVLKGKNIEQNYDKEADNDWKDLQKLLISVKLSQYFQELNESKNEMKFCKCTLILLSKLSKGSEQVILVTKNTQVKFSNIDKLAYFDAIMSLSQSQLNRLGISATLLVMVDLRSATELAKTPNMKIQTIIFHKSISASKYQTEIQPRQQAQQFQVTLYQALRQRLTSDFTQLQLGDSKDTPVEIICKQFIDELCLGIIHLRLKPQQRLKSNKDVTIQIEIDTQIMLQNQVYLLQKIGQLQDFCFSSHKSLLTYRVQLTESTPDFMLVFRIFLDPQPSIQSLNQPKNILQFPPLHSVKISRIFSAQI